MRVASFEDVLEDAREERFVELALLDGNEWLFVEFGHGHRIREAYPENKGSGSPRMTVLNGLNARGRRGGALKRALRG
jgi:hypothetical protein